MTPIKWTILFPLSAFELLVSGGLDILLQFQCRHQLTFHFQALGWLQWGLQQAPGHSAHWFSVLQPVCTSRQNQEEHATSGPEKEAFSTRLGSSLSQQLEQQCLWQRHELSWSCQFLINIMNKSLRNLKLDQKPRYVKLFLISPLFVVWVVFFVWLVFFKVWWQ